jgi:hypothetical protein
MKKFKTENFWLAQRNRREQDQIREHQREVQLLKIVSWCQTNGKIVEQLTPAEIQEALECE